MKKILLLVLVAFVSTTMSAQLVTSTTISKTKKEFKDSGMFMEVGVGTLGADWENDGIALDLGIGYRKGFSEYVAWDIFKVKAIAEVANLSESLTAQIMTGVRGTTPVLFSNMTAFGSFSAGYGYNPEFEAGGFAYEAQIGLNLTKKLYAAFVYDNQKLSFEEEGYSFDAKVSFVGLRFGMRF